MKNDTTLEQFAMSVLSTGMHDIIAKRFEGYSTPLDALLKDVVTRRSAEISGLMDEAITSAIRTGNFKANLCDAFDKKLAKVLLSGFEGEIERRANKLREDPAFRAKITVAIDEAIKSASK